MIAAPIQAVDQQSLAMTLRSGTPQQRERAASLVLSVPTSSTSGDLWAAVFDEFKRTGDVVKRLMTMTDNERKTQPDLKSFFQYREYLVMKISRSTEDRALPLLIGELGSGSMVRDAVVRFGEDAVGPLIQVVRTRTSTMPRIHGAIDALTEILLSTGGVPLSSRARGAIIDVTKDALADPKRLFTPKEVIDSEAVAKGAIAVLTLQRLVPLALATRDPELRIVVTRLANDPSASLKFGLSARQSASLQKRALEWLTKIPEKEATVVM